MHGAGPEQLFLPSCCPLHIAGVIVETGLQPGVDGMETPGIEEQQIEKGEARSDQQDGSHQALPT